MNQQSLALRRVPRVLYAWLFVPVPAIVSLIGWCLFEPCANSVLSELTSPQGNHRAVLFERECSGTVAWVTHLSVLGSGGKFPSEQGNALVSFERHGPIAGNQYQKPDVLLRWLDEHTLEVTHPEGVALQRNVPLAQDVKLVYVVAR